MSTVRTHIDDAMPAWWDIAGTFGHVGLYFDLAPEVREVTTAADQAWPYVRAYTPLDVLDWRAHEDGRLIWIKLLEAVQSAPDRSRHREHHDLSRADRRREPRGSSTTTKPGRISTKAITTSGGCRSCLFGKRRSS
jgi:hypothetical protein